jgi:site-specific DNA-methyltransferase (adenine-specific)
MNTDLMFSSATDKWNTPADLVDDLATVFDWDLDVCANGPNVCQNYYTEADNGLEQPWGDLNWCNPPYGRGDSGCGPWLDAGAWAWQWDKKTTVFLVPARTDTKWWQLNAPVASLVVFICGRLKFGDATNSAPFPSAFIVFGEINKAQRAKLASYGWAVEEGKF